MRPSHAVWITVLVALAFAALGAVTNTIIRLGEPETLFLLAMPALMVALFMGYQTWRAATARRLGHPPTVAQMGASRSGRRQVARFVLTILAVTLIVVAMARPQWGERAREVRRKGIDVVFAVDISRSMLAGDVAPSRLDATFDEIDRTLHLLEGDRVGLVVFAGIAFVQSPLTSDYGAIRLYLDRLDPEDLPVQGTAVGRAIHEATKLLVGGENRDGFERSESQLIVVFSDGEDHETEPVAAARAARAEGIHVYTVGVGTDEGGRIPVRNRDGSIREYFSDRSGNIVVTHLEEAQLREVAAEGGGEYLRYAGDGSVAGNLEDAIAAYDEQALSSVLRQEYEDRFLFFLIPGLLLLGLASLLSERRRAFSLIPTALALLLLSACGDSLMRPDPRVERAMELSGSGDHDRALEELGRVPEEATELPEFQYDYGLVYEGDERWSDAQERYVRALNADDVAGQVSALFALGNALLHQDEEALAIERYRRALLLDPTHAGARRNLEIALLRLYPPCSALDDTFEDDDDAASAADLPATVYQGEYLPPGLEPDPTSTEPPELVACGGDADWYAIPVIGGVTLDVDVRFTRLRDDTGTTPPPEQIAPPAVRVALIGIDGVMPIAVDQGLTGDALEPVDARSIVRRIEGVEIPPNVDEGLAYLQVEVDDPLEYTYAVELTFVPPCWALEDAFETNDSRNIAAALESGDAEARICATNDDWFRVDYGVGDNLFVDVEPPTRDDGQPGVVLLEVFEGDAPTPASSGRLMDRLGEVQVRDAVEPGSVTLRVASQEETEGAYRVRVYHYPPCPEGRDRYEPNDQPDARSQLDPAERPFRHLRLCAGDQDWFEMPLPPVEEEDRDNPDHRPFSALVEYDQTPRALQAIVYDTASGRTLAVSQAVEMAPHEALTGDAPVHGVVAYAPIPWDVESVVVRVIGDPGFYDLSFPHTEDQQQEQEQQQQEQEEDGEESDEQQEDGGEQQEEETPPEPSEPEEEEQGDEEQEQEQEQPEPDEISDEELERELLRQLLDSLEPEDLNLQLQQALEHTPNMRLEREW